MRIIKSNYDVNTIGVEWTTNNPSPTLVQTDQYGNAITMTAAMWAGHKLFGAIRRVNLADNGTVNYVYGDANFKYDGTAGQVMVQIPKFYYRNDSLANKYRYTISPSPRAGYKIHPAFIVNTVEKNFIYVSAFEGYQTGGKLCSLAGQAPAVSADLPTFRGYAQARGTGWELMDFNTLSAVQLLFIIRNATLNSQSVYRGRVDTTSACNTGFTAGVGTGSVDTGNGSGESTQGAGLASFAFCGIENFWGNVYKWTDGIKFLSYDVWIADHGFDDTDPSSTPGTYVNVSDVGGGVGVMAAGGWFVLTDLLYSSAYDYFFLPKSAPASVDYTTYFCDGNHTAHTGLTALCSGGFWDNAASAGAFFVNASNAASDSYAHIGGRLVFK